MRPPPPAGGGGGGLGRAQFAPSRLAQAVCILNVLVCFSVVCLYLLTDEVGDDGRSLLSSNWDRGGLSAAYQRRLLPAKVLPSILFVSRPISSNSFFTRFPLLSSFSRQLMTPSRDQQEDVEQEEEKEKKEKIRSSLFPSLSESTKESSERSASSSFRSSAGGGGSRGGEEGSSSREEKTHKTVSKLKDQQEERGMHFGGEKKKKQKEQEKERRRAGEATLLGHERDKGEGGGGEEARESDGDAVAFFQGTPRQGQSHQASRRGVSSSGRDIPSSEVVKKGEKKEGESESDGRDTFLYWFFDRDEDLPLSTAVYRRLRELTEKEKEALLFFHREGGQKEEEEESGEKEEDRRREKRRRKRRKRGRRTRRKEEEERKDEGEKEDERRRSGDQTKEKMRDVSEKRFHITEKEPINTDALGHLTSVPPDKSSSLTSRDLLHSPTDSTQEEEEVKEKKESEEEEEDEEEEEETEPLDFPSSSSISQAGGLPFRVSSVPLHILRDAQYLDFTLSHLLLASLLNLQEVQEENYRKMLRVSFGSNRSLRREDMKIHSPYHSELFSSSYLHDRFLLDNDENHRRTTSAFSPSHGLSQERESEEGVEEEKISSSSLGKEKDLRKDERGRFGEREERVDEALIGELARYLYVANPMAYPPPCYDSSSAFSRSRKDDKDSSTASASSDDGMKREKEKNRERKAMKVFFSSSDPSNDQTSVVKNKSIANTRSTSSASFFNVSRSSSFFSDRGDVCLDSHSLFSSSLLERLLQPPRALRSVASIDHVLQMLSFYHLEEMPLSSPPHLLHYLAVSSTFRHPLPSSSWPSGVDMLMSTRQEKGEGGEQEEVDIMTEKEEGMSSLSTTSHRNRTSRSLSINSFSRPRATRRALPSPSSKSDLDSFSRHSKMKKGQLPLRSISKEDKAEKIRKDTMEKKGKDEDEKTTMKKTSREKKRDNLNEGEKKEKAPSEIPKNPFSFLGGWIDDEDDETIQSEENTFEASISEEEYRELFTSPLSDSAAIGGGGGESQSISVQTVVDEKSNFLYVFVLYTKDPVYATSKESYPSSSPLSTSIPSASPAYRRRPLRYRTRLAVYRRSLADVLQAALGNMHTRAWLYRHLSNFYPSQNLRLHNHRHSSHRFAKEINQLNSILLSAFIASSSSPSSSPSFSPSSSSSRPVHLRDPVREEETGLRRIHTREGKSGRPSPLHDHRDERNSSSSSRLSSSSSSRKLENFEETRSRSLQRETEEEEQEDFEGGNFLQLESPDALPLYLRGVYSHSAAASSSLSSSSFSHQKREENSARSSMSSQEKKAEEEERHASSSGERSRSPRTSLSPSSLTATPLTPPVSVRREIFSSLSSSSPSSRVPGSFTSVIDSSRHVYSIDSRARILEGFDRLAIASSLLAGEQEEEEVSLAGKTNDTAKNHGDKKTKKREEKEGVRGEEEEEGEETDRVDSKRLILNDVDTWRDLGGCPLPPQMKVISLETVHRAVEYVEGRCVYYTSPEGKELRLKKKKTKKTVARSEEDTSEKRKEERNKEEDGRKKRTDRRDGGGRDGDLHDVNKETFHGEEEVPGEDLSHVHMTGGGIMDQPQETNAALNASSSSHLSSFHSLSSSSSSSLSSSSSPYTFPPGSSSDGSLPPPSLASTVSALYARLSSSVFPPPASLAFVSLHRREMSQALRQILSFPYHPYRMRRALSIFLLSLTRLGGELFLSYSDFAWLLLREGFRCSSSLVRTLWYLVSNPEALYFSMQTSHFSKHRWLNLLPLFEFLHAVYGRGGETKRRAEKKSREGEREEEEDEDEKATSIDDRHLDLSSEGSVKERGEEGRRKDEDDLRSSLKKERRFPRSESTPEVEEEEELPVENEKNGRRHTKKISLTHQETFLSSVSSFFSRFSLLSSLSSLFSPLSRFLQRNVFFFFSSSSFLLFASPSWASPWSIFRLGMSMSFDLLRILWRQQKVFAFRFLEALTAHSFKEKEDELKEEEEREEVDMYRRILRLFERDQEDVHDEEGEEESSFSSSSSSISSSDTYHHEGEEEEDPGDGKRHKKKKKSEDLVSEEQEEEQEGIVKFFFSFFGAIFSPFFSSQGVEERKMPMKRPSISGRKKKHNGVDAIASELLFFPHHHHHLSVVTPQAMMRAAHLGRAFMHAELTERERSAQIEEEEEERQRQEKEEREEILKRDLHAERDEKQSIPFEKHTSQLLKAHDQERRKEIESLDLSGRRTASSKEEGEEEKIEQRRRRRSDEERRISSEREERQEEERQKLFSSLLSSSSSSSPFSRDAFDEGDLFNLSQPEKILSRIGGGQRGSFEQIERETVQKNSFLSLLDLPWMSFRREEGEEAQELEALIRLKKRRNRRDENNRRRRGEEEEEAYLTSLGRDDLEAYDEDRGQPRHDYYSIDHHTQGEKEKIGGDRRRRGRGLPIKNQQSYPHSMRSGDRLYENAWIELLSVFSLQVQKVIDIFRVVKAKLSFSSVEGEEEQATKEDDGGEKEEEEEKRDDHGSSAATKKNRMKGSEGAEAEKEEEKERGVEERFPGIIHEKAKSASHGDAEKRNEEESIQEEEIDHDEDDGTAEEEEEKEEESKLLPSSSSPLPHSLESLFSPSSSPSPPVLFSPTSLAMALRGFQLVRSYSIEGEQAWLAVDSETISAAVVYGQPEGLDMKWRVTLFPRVDHTASLVLQRRRRQWFEQYTKEEAKRAEELAKKRKEDKVPFFSSRSEKQVEDAEEGEGRENKRKDEEEKQRKKKKDSERNAEIRRGRRKPLEMKSDKTSPSAELSEVSSHTPLPTTTALALRIGDPVHDEDDEEIHHFSFLSSSLPLSSSLYPSQKEEEHDRSIPAPSYLTHSDEEDEHTPTIQRSHPTRQRRLCHGERTLQPSHTDEASSLRSMQRPSAPHEGRTQNTQTSFSSSSSSLSCEEEREEEEEEEERDSSILSSYEYATFLFEGSAPVDVGGSLSSNGLVFSRGRADKYLFRHSLSLSSLFHLHRKWLRLQKRMRGKAEKSAEVSVEKSEKKKKGDREEEEKRGEKNYDDGDEEEEDEDVDKNLGDKEQQEEVGASLSRKKKFSTHKKRDIDEKIEDMPLPLPLLPTVVGPRVWQRENLGDVALLRHIDLGKSREDVGSPSSSSVTDDEEQAYKSTGMKKHGGILALIVHSNDRAVRYRTFHMTPSIVSSSHPLCPSRKNLLSSLSARRRHGHVRRGASPSSLSRDRRNPTASFHPDSDEKARKRDQNREEEPEKTSHENNDQDEEGCVSWIVGNKEGTDHFVRVLQPGSSTSHTSGQTHSEGGGGGEGRGERTRGRSSGDSHNPRESRGGEGERETSSSSQSGGGGGGEGVYEFVRKPLWCSSRHRRFFAFGYLLKLQSFHLRTRSLTSSSSSSSLRSPLGANEGEAKTSSSGRMKKKKKIEPKSWILREEARQMKAEDADGRTAWRLGNIMGGGWMVGPSTSSSSSPRGRHYQQDDFSDQREEEAERRREREGEEDEKEEDEQDQLSQYEARGVFEEFWRYSPSFRLLSISEDGRYIVGVTGALKVYLQIEDPSASLTAVRTPEETEKNRNGPPFSRRSSHRFSSSVEMNGSTDGKASREGEHDRSTMESEEKNSSDFSPKVREVDVAEALVRAGGDPRNRSIVSVSFFPLHRFIPILDPHLVQQGVIPPPPDRVYLVILLDDGRLLLLYVHPDATLVPTATPFFHHLLFSLSWNNLAMLVYLLVFLLFHLRGQLLIGGGAGGGGGGPGTTNGAGGGGLRQAVWRFWYLMVSLLRIFLSLLLFPLISLLFTLIRALRIILLEIAVLYSHLLQVLLPFPAATNNTPNTNTRNANDTTTPPTPNNPTDNVNGLTTTTTTPAASAASITPPHANTSVNTATTTATSTEEDGENNNNARTNRRGGDQQQEEESPPKSSRSSSRSGNGVEGSSSSSSRSHVRAGGILDEGGRPQQQQEECERNEGGVSRHLSGKGGGESKVFGGQERPATERGGEDEGKSELRDGENDRKKAGMIETLRKERNEIDREEERRDKGGETTKLLEKIQEEEGLSRRRRDLPSKASDNESSERHTSPQAQALSQREGRLGRGVGDRLARGDSCSSSSSSSPSASNPRSVSSMPSTSRSSTTTTATTTTSSRGGRRLRPTRIEERRALLAEAALRRRHTTTSSNCGQSAGGSISGVD
ncbi:transmembrane protein [Cystoisospora suis]|uniref:Transmembrane protein n=1 Tax=Cystoisospora suis TaxID=483139 RepID=A0A2C6KKV2_9APIC|nr:transmembrane protein [Cystoisospora suis]